MKDGIVRLGHPGASITQIIVRNFNLLVEYNNIILQFVMLVNKPRVIGCIPNPPMFPLSLQLVFHDVFSLMERWSPLSQRIYETGGNRHRVHDVGPERAEWYIYYIEQ